MPLAKHFFGIVLHLHASTVNLISVRSTHWFYCLKVKRPDWEVGKKCLHLYNYWASLFKYFYFHFHSFLFFFQITVAYFSRGIWQHCERHDSSSIQGVEGSFLSYLLALIMPDLQTITSVKSQNQIMWTRKKVYNLHLWTACQSLVFWIHERCNMFKI